METEIIKTENPNIVIKRTIFESEINIENQKSIKDGLLNLLSELRQKVSQLESVKNVPVLLKDVVSKEINEIKGEIFTYENEVAKIDNLLNI